MNHLMIDIETLDTRPTAVVLSIGILRFDPFSRVQALEGSWTLDPAEQLQLGRTMSLDTVTWWMQQGYEARKKAFASELVCSLEDTQRDIIGILGSNNIGHIWANDPDFDCTILRDFVGHDFKWPFYKHRSIRTIKAIFPEAYNPPGKEYGESVAHDPVEDCNKQAWHVMNVYEHIAKTKLVGG